MKAAKQGRRSGEIRYYLKEQTLQAATEGDSNFSLDSLADGATWTHTVLSPRDRDVLVGWHPVDSCTKWASSAKTSRMWSAQRLWATPARRFELLPLPLSGPPRNLLEDSLLSPGQQPCEAIAIDRIEKDIQLGIISQLVMSPFTRSYIQTHRPRDYNAWQWIAPSTRLVANWALRHCRESG